MPISNIKRSLGRKRMNIIFGKQPWIDDVRNSWLCYFGLDPVDQLTASEHRHFAGGFQEHRR